MKAKIKAKSNINISDIFLPWVKKIKYANTPSGLGGVWRFLSILGGLILLGFVLLLTYRGHSPNQSMTSTYLLKQTRTSVGALGQTESNGVDLKDGQGLDHLGGDLYPKDSDLINFQSSNKTGMDSRSNQELTTRRNAPTEIYTANSNDNNGGNLAGTTSISVTHAVPLAHPEETVAEGEFLHGVLETAINSDVPGMVRAVLTRPVYAYTGFSPLIPAGSRLIGQYETSSSNGLATERIFIIWNRLITPSGISIELNSPGADALGQGGMGANHVDLHFWKIFGTAALLSIMGAAVATEGVGSQDQPNSANNYQQAIANSFNQSTQNALSGNQNIRPTLHINQGEKITIFVAHDLDLSGVLNN